jgi:hypothetical protein
MNVDAVRTKLLLALRAIATADDGLARAYMRELEALVKAMSFLPETKELAQALQPEMASGIGYYSFPPCSPETLDECIRVFVQAERSTDSVPGHVWDFFKAVLVMLMPAKSVPAERLLFLMSDEGCAIDSYQSLCAAVDRLNDYTVYPKAVTLDRCTLVAEKNLPAEQLCALSADELRDLALELGFRRLENSLTIFEQRRQFRRRCQEFQQPAAKRQRTE